MRSSTPDALPAQVPAAQVSADAPAAGNDRPAALTARLADLASFTADIAAAILGGPVLTAHAAGRGAPPKNGG